MDINVAVQKTTIQRITDYMWLSSPVAATDGQSPSLVAIINHHVFKVYPHHYGLF